MVIAHGTLAQPLEAARDATRQGAAALGYALAEGESTPYRLVFKKGVALLSLGSQVTVTLEDAGPSETRLTVATGETLALPDLGRGRRAAHRLLDALGAGP